MVEVTYHCVLILNNLFIDFYLSHITLMNVFEIGTWNVWIFCGTRESSVVPSPSWPFWFLPQLQ